MRRSLLLLGLLTLAGCGGAGDARVDEYVPGAHSVRCEHPSRSLTRCHAETGNSLTGARTWTCEFTYDRASGARAYTGTETCWSDSR